MVVEIESERIIVYVSDFIGDILLDYNQVLRERERQIDSRERKSREREIYFFFIRNIKNKSKFFF